MESSLAETVAHNLQMQRERIEGAARKAGRPIEAVRLIAVSKLQSVEKIECAYRAGQRDFGENYVQELTKKAEELAHLEGIRWHLIGHLQSNKAKYVADLVDTVHTVSSAKLAKELGRRVVERRTKLSGLQGDANTAGFLRVLVEVNVSGEQNKSGCAPERVGEVLDALDEQQQLSVQGLMTVPPNRDNPEDARPFFERLGELRDIHGGLARLPELSMGMSRDAEVAVACGATMVRIGTAIFGQRNP